VLYNLSCPKQVSFAIGPVTPAQSSAFYATALPRAGYSIEGNISSSQQGLTEVEFSGHGYTGGIIAMANPGAAASANPSGGSVTLPSSMSKNVAEISMSANGTSSSYVCPNLSSPHRTYRPYQGELNE
jgi:hypothetical protein